MHTRMRVRMHARMHTRMHAHMPLISGVGIGPTGRSRCLSASLTYELTYLPTYLLTAAAASARRGRAASPDRDLSRPSSLRYTRHHHSRQLDRKYGTLLLAYLLTFDLPTHHSRQLDRKYGALPAPSFQLPASSFQLPTSSFQLPASCLLLPACYLLLPTPTGSTGACAHARIYGRCAASVHLPHALSSHLPRSARGYTASLRQQRCMPQPAQSRRRACFTCRAPRSQI